MDENRASALQYGHLGKAIYLPERRSWAFSRSLEQRKTSIRLQGTLLTAYKHL
jgi:hypothetical protein